MKKCVDSSPLVVTYHHSEGRTKASTAAMQGQSDVGGEESQDTGGEGDRGGEGEGEGCFGRVYIGSHGGDFSALDARTGRVVWTLDLEADFNSRRRNDVKESGHGDEKRSRLKDRRRRGRIHVEGSASCDVTGRVVYVGCFRGDDVDGVQGGRSDGKGGSRILERSTNTHLLHPTLLHPTLLHPTLPYSTLPYPTPP